MRTAMLLTTLAALLALPSLPAAPIPKDEPKLPPPTKEQLRNAVNNLKQIALAMHNHESAFAYFPNNTYADGKPLLSWRVAILPYLEEFELYQQFKLEEAWDSETNKKLIERMPKIYAPIRAKAKAGETFYRGFTGKNAPFGPDHGKGRKIAQFTDGTSNTGLVFEAGEPAIWTKPDDLVLDPKKPMPKLGGLFDGECHVALGDGSVVRLKKDADEKELRKLIVVDDGENVDFAKLKK